MTLLDQPIQKIDNIGDTAIAADDTEVALSSFARCSDGNGTLTHLFFSDDEFDLARAKAICRLCGLAEQCLSDALDRAETYGVWGGQLVIEGAVVTVKRGRGRPPKHPRPPLVVDEVPLPPTSWPDRFGVHAAELRPEPDRTPIDRIATQRRDARSLTRNLLDRGTSGVIHCRWLGTHRFEPLHRHPHDEEGS